MTNDADGYKLGKAYVHLKKARALLKELHVLNDKSEGSFTALMNYCCDILTTHKHRNEYEQSGISQET